MTDVSVTLRPPCWCLSAWAPTGCLHTKLYKFGWNTFPNNARMNYRTGLNLGEVGYIWIIFYIPDFWINLLNGYDFYFWWRDTANQPLITQPIRKQESVAYLTVLHKLNLLNLCHAYVKNTTRVIITITIGTAIPMKNNKNLSSYRGDLCWRHCWHFCSFA